MQKQPSTPQGPSMQQVMQLAQSPAGQKLIAMMHNSSDPAVRQAMELAASGNYKEAASRLSGYFATPEAQELRKQLEK